VTTHLTVRQKLILQTISDYWLANGIAPTVRDIARLVGCYPSTAAHHLGVLEAAGRIERRPRIPRSMKVVDQAEVA
jgi:repressor LexA